MFWSASHPADKHTPNVWNTHLLSTHTHTSYSRRIPLKSSGYTPPHLHSLMLWCYNAAKDCGTLSCSGLCVWRRSVAVTGLQTIQGLLVLGFTKEKLRGMFERSWLFNSRKCCFRIFMKWFKVLNWDSDFWRICVNCNFMCFNVMNIGMAFCMRWL